MCLPWRPGLLPPVASIFPVGPAVHSCLLFSTGKGLGVVLERQHRALRVDLPGPHRWQRSPSTRADIAPAFGALACLSIFVLFQINSRNHSLSPKWTWVRAKCWFPRFLNNSKATKRRGAAVETLDQQVTGASPGRGGWVGWAGRGSGAGQ